MHIELIAEVTCRAGAAPLGPEALQRPISNSFKMRTPAGGLNNASSGPLSGHAANLSGIVRPAFCPGGIGLLWSFLCCGDRAVDLVMCLALILPATCIPDGPCHGEGASLVRCVLPVSLHAHEAGDKALATMQAAAAGCRGPARSPRASAWPSSS